jgi:integrase
MASIWRHPKSQYWTACFRDAQGRQRRISTKETNRSRARKIAEGFERVAKVKSTKLHIKRVIEALHAELGGGEPSNSISLTDFADQWLAAKQPTVAPRTFGFYREGIAKLIAFLGLKADAPIDVLTRAHLVGFRNARAAKVSPSSVNADMRVVRMLLLAAIRDEIISENPAKFVESVRARNGSGAQSERRAFTIPELQAALSVADPEWRSMILFGVYTGQRLSDIASLTWSNIDLLKGELRLTTQKTGRLLILPLAPPLVRHLEAIPCSDDPSAPLHPRAASIIARNGRSAALSNQFGDLLADAGLRPRQSKRGGGNGRNTRRQSSQLSFHSLRRTATTLLHEAGVPQQVVQAMIGHDSTEVHQLYVAIGPAALRQAAAALPEL